MSKETFGRMMGGSLVRRTIVATAALLLGSSLFVGLVSLALVGAVEGLLPPGKAPAEAVDRGADSADADLADDAAKAPLGRSLRPKRTGSVTDKSGANEAER